MGFLNSAGSFLTEKRPRLGVLGNTGMRYSMRTNENMPIHRNVMRHPMYRPIIRPMGSPNIIATEVPTTIMLNAVFLNFSGTVRTAKGDTIDQKMECAQATPILDIMSMP